MTKAKLILTLLNKAQVYSALYSNLTKEERNTLYSLKEANKGSAVVVWDRKDYLVE